MRPPLSSRLSPASGLRSTAALLAGASVAVLGLASPSADACGGFFCSQSQPVNQAAERILFVDDGEGSVTAVVQILYEGPAESFSWVLPVPGIPDVDVSSNMAFTRLQQATNPTYRLNTVIEGECAQGPDLAAGEAAPPPSDADGGGGNGGVEVVASGAVGPYDYEVISVDPGFDDAAQVAVEWLEDNGYDVTAIGPDVLRPYLEGGMNLLGFRLQKQRAAGEIRPITMTYETERPMIPIRPTAVAANDDMGVMVWNFDDARTVPVNYPELVLNEAVIDWFNPSDTYNDVINLAADEAGGQGFVTEMAASTDALEGVVFRPFEEEERTRLLNDDFAQRHGELLNRTWNLFGGWDGYPELVERTLDGLVDDPNDVVTDCVPCVVDSNTETIDGFDEAAFVDGLLEEVVDPMRETEALVQTRPYFTRHYTTMSADEMTLDPEFDANPDLPDHSNVHVQDRVIECNAFTEIGDAPWRVELPQGDTVRGVGFSWPVALDEQPAILQAIERTTSGAGSIVINNATAISDALDESNAVYTPPGCGCSANGDDDPLAASLALLGLVAAVRLRRRRARRG